MDIITLARELGAAIQQDELYIDYKIKEQNVECDMELQKTIEDFNSKKSEINIEISKDNADSKKIDELNSSIGELYKKITQNPKMEEYNEAKQKFDDRLQKVSLIINSASAGQDPYSVDISEDTSCTGSCQTCHGCS
ncbi:MAG: YlbF family regulator [Clostridia bacterium]|nr:YlbF family regulator [Clostridia bacterium]